jgi:type II secretory pathway pseudopilin PulG
MNVQAIRQALAGAAGGVAQSWARRRPLWLAFILLTATAITVAWFVRLADAPARQAGREVDLSALGGPAVTIQVVYPTRLSVWEGPQPLTVWVRAADPAAALSLSLALDLPDRAAAYVDSEGNALAGRLAVTPGYPEAQPYTVWVQHNDTQYQSGLWRAYRLRVVPEVSSGDWSAVLADAAFEMRLENRWTHAYRRLALWISAVGLPYLWLLAVAALAVWVIGRLTRRQRAARERELAGLYVELRQQVRLRQWPAARECIDRLRLLRANYRDVDQLDVIVSAAETATWRREQLYSAGVQAYRERRWPDAVRNFEEIEKETAYYRDVRFLRRTSALYADLASRDRSQRVAAACELGEVADLVDLVPLLEALGDRSDEVAAAAEGAFRRIGRDAFEVLLAGLRYDHEGLRQRACRLIKEMGQAVRGDLVQALRHDDPRITAAAAGLLMELGARQEVAEALLEVGKDHEPPAWWRHWWARARFRPAPC